MDWIVVLGGGIVGASAAWHLSRGGARVTVVDPEGAGGQATGASWSWINASWGYAESYFRLRYASMACWRDLAAVPGVEPAFCGSVCWDLSEAEMREAAEVQGRWGYDIRLVEGAEVSRLLPTLAAPPALALLAPGEGAVEPVGAARALIADAGADVVRSAATAIDGDGVVLADGTRVAADHVVIAAGAGTPALVAPLGVELPMTTPAGLLAFSAPMPPLIDRLVVSPDLHVRQRPDGSLLAGSGFAGSDPGEDAEAVARGLMDQVGAMFGIDPPPLGGWTVGHRPTPGDGLSVVGRVADGVSVAFTHSGVTLAPILGRILADDLLHGRADPLAASFRPDRFVSA
jgi:glycine/D-amino acid oxidase-like deaminating enzyme